MRRERVIIMSWIDNIVGTWAADDLRRAFVMGARWWEFHQTGATMWQSDQRLAEEKAEEYFPGGRLPDSDRKRETTIEDIPTTSS